MRVLVAGATGAIGRRLVPKLVEAGHDVVGMTRSPEKAGALRDAGAQPAVADALDAGAVQAAVREARPEVVVNQLTAIPKAINPRAMARQFALTNRLRSEGTAHLVAAARAAGARRVVAQSVAFAYAPRAEGLHAEEETLFLDAPAPFASTVRALHELETATLGADDLEGVVLRYGYFYGPGTAYAADGSIAEQVRRRRFPIVGRGSGIWSFIHVEDAARATLAAIEDSAQGAYNVVDDEPAPVSEWLPAYADAIGARSPRRAPAPIARIVAGPWAVFMMTRLRGASNAKAKRELSWEPRPASWRQGFVEALG
jgi:nucleoside-diphosphate-sugar epimerase